MTFEDWQEDVALLAGWLKRRSPERPLALHGLQMGGLLAGAVFKAGVGDALLLWSPGAHANELLRQGILRRIAVDHTFKDPQDRKPLSSYLQELEGGGSLEVEGYRWPAHLWHASFHLQNAFATGDGMCGDGRPVRSVTLPRSAAPLIKGSSLGYIVSLNPDLTPLFADSLAWISSVLDVRAGGSN